MCVLLAAGDKGAVDFGGDGVFFEAHFDDQGAECHAGVEGFGFGVDGDGGGGHVF